MTTVLQNFVTIRKTRGDVLSPTEFRTIVEMVLGILKKYDYAGLNDDYKLFLAHLVDYNDPHHDANTNFLEEILEQIYTIYTYMVASPLSLADFKTQIVPTMGFLELIRRIVLNRYLYNQVMTSTGSVPATATALLSGDWGYDNLPITPTTLNFGSEVPNENSFISLGEQGNTTPIETIFNAETLNDLPYVLPVIFSYGSDNPYFFLNTTTTAIPISLALPSNDFTLDLQVVNTAANALTPVTLTNGTDTVAITINTDKSILISVNNTPFTAAAIPSINGQYRISFRRDGTIALQTIQEGISVDEINQMTYTSGRPFNLMTVSLGLEDLITQKFALRSLCVRRGFDPDDFENTIVVPAGYILLSDTDGAILTDADGIPLMDYDFTVPDGYSVLLDSDQSILTDTDGSYLIDVT